MALPVRGNPVDNDTSLLRCNGLSVNISGHREESETIQEYKRSIDGEIERAARYVLYVSNNDLLLY